MLSIWTSLKICHLIKGYTTTFYTIFKLLLADSEYVERLSYWLRHFDSVSKIAFRGVL